jgi:hypothetical protein
LKNEWGPIAPSREKCQSKSRTKGRKTESKIEKAERSVSAHFTDELANANKVIREDPMTENCAMAEMPFLSANFQSPYANIAKRFIR